MDPQIMVPMKHFISVAQSLAELKLLNQFWVDLVKFATQLFFFCHEILFRLISLQLKII